MDSNQLETSRYFAYLKRLRYVKRWSLMRNFDAENVMEHSWEVSVIAHTLAVIKNQLFGGNLDVNAVATAALYHDASEILTGDMPTPVKYQNPEIYKAYKDVERLAGLKLTELLPSALRNQLQPLLCQQLAPEVEALVKAADKIQACIKACDEVEAGNREFQTASVNLYQTIKEIQLPEVQYFISVFISPCYLNLDCLVESDQ